MKVALFGATGRTGKILLNELIKNTYSVRSIVRNPSKIPFSHPMLEIVHGDATNFEQVYETVKGCNAVISVIGYTKGSKAGFQSIAMKNIIKAMELLSIDKIIVLSGSGIPQNHDMPSYSHKILTFFIKLIAPVRYYDGIKQVELLENSNLNYTVIRAPILTNGKMTQNYKTGTLWLHLFSHISRSDVTHFTLQLLKDFQYYKRQMPQISY